MTLRLFLVRHGETESNRQGIALGQADPPLNDLGREQARRLAGALAGEGFAAVYASPLARARQTAAPIAERSGVDVTVEQALIEMDIGALDGLDFATVRERFPEFIDRWLSDDGPRVPMPGGESLVDVCDRALKFVDRVAATHANGSVCAVTHNFVILSLLAGVLELDLARFRQLRQGVAAVSVIEWDGNRWRLEKMNDTCHLE